LLFVALAIASIQTIPADELSAQEAQPAAQALSVSLTANPSTITPGQSASLLPQFNRGSGTISPGVGAVRPGVPAMVTPAATTTYTLTVKWRSQVVTRSATVAVQPGAVTVAVSPAAVTLAEGATQLFTATVS